MKKKIISLIICVLLLTACGTGYKTITENEAMPLIENNAMIIEIINGYLNLSNIGNDIFIKNNAIKNHNAKLV